MHESSRPPWLGRRISSYARLPWHLFAAACALACQGGEPDGLAGAGSGDGARARSAVIPERVVSLAPNLTEIVYALGERDRLVGVTRYCKFPPEAQEKPKVGALVNMNYERLLELEPDLVLVLPGHADVVNELDRLEIDSVTIRTETIADIYAAIEKIGEVFETGHIAGRLIAELQGEMAAVRARTGKALANDGRPGAPPAPPRVLFVIGRNPGTLEQIYAAGSESFLDEMLTAVGAVNALENTASPWPIISREAIVSLDPDVILDGSIYRGDAPDEDDAHMRAWERLDTLRAVAAHRIYSVEDEHILIPGPGVAESARALAELIFGTDAAPLD